MKIVVPCAVCGEGIQCSPNRKASARQPVCHSCRRKTKTEKQPRITSCKVCGYELVTPVQRGGVRQFCNEHAGLHHSFCQSCEQQSWKTHPTNKRCVKCVKAGSPVADKYIPECKQPGCNQKHHAKGYCASHYNKYCLPKQDYSKVVRSMVSAVCNRCGVTFQRSTKAARKYCTKECANKNRGGSWKLGGLEKTNRPPGRRKTMKTQHCEWCDESFEAVNKRRFCSKDCQRLWQRDNAKPGTTSDRSPLAVALENHDYGTVIAEVFNRAVVTADGCWEWPTTDKSGYARFQGRSLYRAVLESKEQAPLGSQAAHHKCGNSACVNPDHLQAVTHAENSAEMLQRRAYVRRIEELEEALRAVAPSHPVLHRIQLAQQTQRSA